jgi:hypothetical protein
MCTAANVHVMEQSLFSEDDQIPLQEIFATSDGRSEPVHGQRHVVSVCNRTVSLSTRYWLLLFSAFPHASPCAYQRADLS